MAKFILILLTLFTIKSNANALPLNKSEINLNKPLDRFLYETYFKQLFKYEPAMIRENHISHLKVISKQKIGDSLISSSVNHKILFRQDGRPMQMVEWSTYYHDSLITDYSYDSLNNLIECNVWSPSHKYAMNGKLIKSRSQFIYQGRKLFKVLNFYNPNGGNNLQLNRYDSLSSSLFESKITIFYGALAKANVIVNPNSHKLPLVKFNRFQVYNFVESNEKYFDDESFWAVECTFMDTTLIKLQKLTGNLCFSNYEVNVIKNNGNIFSPFENENLPIHPKLNQNMVKIGKQLYIDTSEQRIYKYQNFFYSEPTSLENRNTSTNSVSIYNYAMRLLKVESVRESSRGQYEYGKDSSETYFSYFDFGLLQLKQEFHYNTNRFGNQLNNEKNENVWIKEEETVIKRWDN